MEFSYGLVFQVLSFSCLWVVLLLFGSLFRFLNHILHGSIIGFYVKQTLKVDNEARFVLYERLDALYLVVLGSVV